MAAVAGLALLPPPLPIGPWLGALILLTVVADGIWALWHLRIEPRRAPRIDARTGAWGMRDRDRFRNAFQELRGLGYWSRSDQDGANSGWGAVPVDILRRDGKVVFWHTNETAIAFNGDGDLVSPLHLHHKARDAQEIVRVLTTHGLHPRLTGDRGEELIVVDPEAA